MHLPELVHKCQKKYSACRERSSHDSSQKHSQNPEQIDLNLFSASPKNAIFGFPHNFRVKPKNLHFCLKLVHQATNNFFRTCCVRSRVKPEAHVSDGQACTAELFIHVLPAQTLMFWHCPNFPYESRPAVSFSKNIFKILEILDDIPDQAENTRTYRPRCANSKNLNIEEDPCYHFCNNVSKISKNIWWHLWSNWKRAYL